MNRCNHGVEALISHTRKEDRREVANTPLAARRQEPAKVDRDRNRERRVGRCSRPREFGTIEGGQNHFIDRYVMLAAVFKDAGDGFRLYAAQGEDRLPKRFDR